MVKKIKSKAKFQPRAFNLIEMSIVILIAGILISSTLTATKGSIRNNNYKLTKQRMEIINKALTSFLASNRRLPCPASFAVVSTASNYGAEGTAAGNCTTAGGTASTPTYTDLVWGMVPTMALGLTSEMATDGFGTRFSYVVDKRFTVATATTSSTTGFEYTAGTPQGSVTTSTTSASYAIVTAGATGGNIINIRDGSTSGTVINSIALYVLVSHGANKLGGYNPLNTTPNSTTNAGAAETENFYSSGFDNLFVTNPTDTTSDDLISYRTKLQLVYDAGLEAIMCSNKESYYCSNSGGAITTSSCSGSASILSWNNTTYNITTNASPADCIAPAGGNSRTCNKYGQWSTPTCTSPT